MNELILALSTSFRSGNGFIIDVFPESVDVICSKRDGRTSAKEEGAF